MKKSTKTLLIASAITGSLAIGLAHAMSPEGGEHCPQHGQQMGSGRHGMDSDSRVDRMAKSLDLTEKQRDQVRAIEEKSRPQLSALQDKMAENRKQLHSLTSQGTAKESELRPLADQQGKLMADMIVMRSQVRTEVQALLTPEQREKMQKQMEQHGQHRHSGRHGEPDGKSES